MTEYQRGVCAGSRLAIETVFEAGYIDQNVYLYLIDKVEELENDV